MWITSRYLLTVSVVFVCLGQERFSTNDSLSAFVCPRLWEYYPYNCPEGYERICANHTECDDTREPIMLCCSNPNNCLVECMKAIPYKDKRD